MGYSLLLLDTAVCCINLVAPAYSPSAGIREQIEAQQRQAGYKIDVSSFEYCFGQYLILYKQIKPLVDYTPKERRLIADWILFKCGDNPQARYEN